MKKINVFLKNLQNELFYSKKQWFRLVCIILLPFIYTFIYLAAFWNPFAHSNNLKAQIINHDSSNIVFDKFKAYIGEEISINPKKPQTEKIHINYLNSSKETENLRENVFSLIIPGNYYENLTHYIDGDKGYAAPQIEFYNSYKTNYFIGEITTLSTSYIEFENTKYFLNEVITHLKNPEVQLDANKIKNILEKIISIPALSEEINKIIQTYTHDPESLQKLNNLVTHLNDFLMNANENSLENLLTLNVHTQGDSKIDIYGYSLAPLFLCIGLWVGALFAATFVPRNWKNESNFFKNFIKSFSLIAMINFVQIVLVVSSITFLGWTLINQFYGYVFYYFVVLAFSAMCLSLKFFLKDPDSTRFIGIILLILQITSSGAILPVDLQPAFYQFFSHISPFFYVTQATKELYLDFDAKVFWISVLYFLVIICSFTSFFSIVSFLKNKAAKRKENENAHQ